MKELLMAMEKDHRFRIDPSRSRVITNKSDVKGNHEVHLHLGINPDPITILALGADWLNENDRKKRGLLEQKFWMGLITSAVRTHAPKATPVWSFKENKGRTEVTLGAVKTMDKEETREFMKFAKSKNLD